MGARIIIGVHGSAGDLFPILPVADALTDSGHNVTLVVPRFLGIHLRLLGRDHVVYGRSTRIADLADRRLMTSRFDGWASWRRLFSTYLRATLAEDISGARAAIKSAAPDLVVTANAAIAPRVAALTGKVPHLALSIFPQLFRLGATGAPRFATPLLDELRALVSPVDADPRLLAFGVTDDALVLHDPALADLSALAPSAHVVGYPYWDGAAARPADVEAADEWLADTTSPVVLVTLGSYVHATQLGQAVIAAMRGADVRVLVLGGGRIASEGNMLAVGYLPVSQVAARCAAVLHHGGLGTMIGAVRAGRPAVVIPCAFDQPGNASLVERAGLGVRAAANDVRAKVEQVLAHPTMAHAAEAMCSRLIAADVAAQRAANHIATTAGAGP